MQQIQIKTNEQNMYANLGHIFSDPTSFIAELKQNARRAGKKNMR